MQGLRHFFIGGFGGAMVGFLLCFIPFYLLTATFRGYFLISVISYLIIGFLIGGIFCLSRYLLLLKYHLLNEDKVINFSFIGIFSAVLGCVPSMLFFFYDSHHSNNVQLVISMPNQLEDINPHLLDFLYNIGGIILFSIIVTSLVGAILSKQNNQ